MLSLDHLIRVVNQAELKDVKDGQIKSNENVFECNICFQLVYNPVMCCNCNNTLYCKHCQTKMKECGACRKKQFEPIDKIIKSILLKKQVICMQEGCVLLGSPITYEQLVMYHAASCGTLAQKCPFCQMLLESSKEAKDHFDEVCPEFLIQCECGIVIKRA